MPRLFAFSWAMVILLATSEPSLAQNRVVDLRNTNVARNIQTTLRDIAQGNERSSGIDHLTFDGNSGVVSGKIWVRHRQVSGRTPKIFNPFSGRHEGGDPIVTYDLTQSASFQFNVTNGSGHVNLDLGRGVRLDTRRIERILEGDLAAIVEMVPSGGVVTKKFRNEYEQISQSYYDRYGGRRNVYFASPRFVSWATPETAGKWVLTAVASGGSAAVAQAMREAKQKALEELRPLSDWLRANGVREAESMARAILTGDRVDWPDLQVKWQTVGYFSQNYLAGRAAGPEMRVTHAAFVIIWRQGPRPTTGGSTPKEGEKLGQTAPGTVWSHSAGSFERQADGSWVEKDRQGKVSFRFTQRGDGNGYVDLYDASRGYTVRLRSDAMLMQGGKPGLRIFNEFTKVYDGRWVR